MIRVDRLYENLKSKYNMHEAGFFRPIADFIPAAHEASLDFLNKLCGIETKSQKVQAILNPFKKKANLVVESKDNESIAPFPGDYKYYRAGSILLESGKTCADPECKEVWAGGDCKSLDEFRKDFYPVTTKYERKKITLITANEWSGVMEHPTRKPCFDLPYLKEDDNYFTIAPEEIGVVVIEYYRLPKEPVFNYKERQDGAEVFMDYVDEGSVHLEWGEEMIPAFLYALGKRYGLTVEKELIVQVTAIDKVLI